MVTAEQLKELVKRLEALKGYLELDKKAIEIQNEEEKTQAPEFWDDPKKAEIILKEIKSKKAWIEEYETVKAAFDDVNVLREFLEMEEATQDEVEEAEANAVELLENLELKNMVSNGPCCRHSHNNGYSKTKC